MANSSSNALRQAPKKKAVLKPKTQTLLIRSISPETAAALSQAKKECGSTTNTAAAVHMMKNYWFLRESLEAANRKIQELEHRLSRVRHAVSLRQQADDIFQEELLKD